MDDEREERLRFLDEALAIGLSEDSVVCAVESERALAVNRFDNSEDERATLQ